MKTKLYIIFNCFFSISITYAQNSQGGRLTAMANNGTAVEDIWAVAANPAGITAISTTSFQFSHQKHFLPSELSTQAIAFVLPSANYKIGIHVQRYGMNSYHENKASLILSKAYGPYLSIGLRANYHQISIENYGATHALSIDAGIMYHFIKNWHLGLYLTNPSLEKYKVKPLPTSLSIGLSYMVSEKLLMATTFKYDFDQNNTTAIGIEYQLSESFLLRSGLSLSPFKHYGGLGLNLRHLSVDIAVSNIPNLGYSPQITIGYVF